MSYLKSINLQIEAIQKRDIAVGTDLIVVEEQDNGCDY